MVNKVVQLLIVLVDMKNHIVRRQNTYVTYFKKSEVCFFAQMLKISSAKLPSFHCLLCIFILCFDVFLSMNIDRIREKTSKQKRLLFPVLTTHGNPPVATAFPIAAPPVATMVAVTHFVVATGGPPVATTNGSLVKKPTRINFVVSF